LGLSPFVSTKVKEKIRLVQVSAKISTLSKTLKILSEGSLKSVRGPKFYN